MKTNFKKHFKIKSIVSLLMLAVIFSGFVGSVLSHADKQKEALKNPDLVRVVDQVGILTAEQVKILNQEVKVFMEKHNADMLVALLPSNLSSSSIEKLGIDVFNDPEGYGVGEDSTGVALIFNVKSRKWTIRAQGRAEKIMGDRDDLERIFEKVAEHVKDHRNNYFDGFREFIKISDQNFTRGKPMPVYMPLWFRLMIIFVFTGIVVGVLVHQMSNVRKQTTAREYLVEGSFVLNDGYDRFSHTVTTKTKRSDSGSSSGGGSSGGGSSASGSY